MVKNKNHLLHLTQKNIKSTILRLPWRNNCSCCWSTYKIRIPQHPWTYLTYAIFWDIICTNEPADRTHTQKALISPQTNCQAICWAIVIFKKVCLKFVKLQIFASQNLDYRDGERWYITPAHPWGNLYKINWEVFLCCAECASQSFLNLCEIFSVKHCPFIELASSSKEIPQHHTMVEVSLRTGPLAHPKQPSHVKLTLHRRAG